MNILYIEDEIAKAKQVVDYVKSISENIKIVEKRSYTSGVLEIRSHPYDCLLLDMSLPLYDIGNLENSDQNEFETFAGLDILEEIIRINIKVKVIVITAFDILGENDDRINLEQLDDKMRSEYSDVYLGSIHYNISSLEWRKQLSAYLTSIG